MTGNQINHNPSAFSTTLIGLSIVASVATFFRFNHLSQWLVFSADQGRAMLAGRNILLGHWLWWGPPTSVSGFSLGPFYYYLTAIALWFSRFDPIGPAVMVSTCGVVATLILFRWTQRYWDNLTAITAGLLLALSPLAVAQSRIPVEPSPLPLFWLLWLAAATFWLETKQRRWLAITLVINLLSIQLNFAAIIGLPVLATVWLIQTKRLVIDRKRLMFWLGSWALLLLVWYKSWRGPQTDPRYLAAIWQQLTTPDHWLAATALWTILVIGLWRLYQGARRRQTPVLLLFVWLIWGSWALLVKHVSGDHSLVFLFPAVALVLALGIRSLLSQSIYWSLAGLVLGLLLLSGQTQPYLSRQKPTLPDHYFTVSQIIALAQNQPYALVYRGYLDIYPAADDHYQYLLWLAGQPPVDSARIELSDQYREQWLLQGGVPVRTIYLYYPWYEADRYPNVGRRQRVGNFILELEY